MSKTLLLRSFQLHPTYLETLPITFEDTIVLLDPLDLKTRHPYHHFRLIFHRSALKHYELELKNKGYQVILDDKDTLKNLLLKYDDPNTYAYIPTDKADQEAMSSFNQMNWMDDPLFIVSHQTWEKWLQKKPWKMDTYYRKLRSLHGILMDQDKPVGGKYSYDQDNRKPFKKGLHFHPPLLFEPDDLTQQVIKDIQLNYPNDPTSKKPFHYAVTRADVLLALDHFIEYRLASFGDYQDVMKRHDPFMSHSIISPYINIGLLSPLEVILKAQDAYKKGIASLASVEGFIRQLLGWREYIRGVYLMTPHYHELNMLNHTRELPSFYWGDPTDLYCLSETIKETHDNSYNHHIQRLMILSNYANLEGIHPKALNDWFNAMYIDSFDWVVTPNVMGMGTYADGGQMSTKPYISSGAYIHKMSNYCDTCNYDPYIKTGPKACPFNYLYWDFIQRHEPRLKTNPRMSLMVNLWHQKDDVEKQAILQSSQHYKKSRDA
jgi:deoxyribodipyrimidine photolyase-related protein